MPSDPEFISRFRRVSGQPSRSGLEMKIGSSPGFASGRSLGLSRALLGFLLYVCVQTVPGLAVPELQGETYVQRLPLVDDVLACIYIKKDTDTRGTVLLQVTF